MATYVIQQNNGKRYYGGSKAIADVHTIFRQEGYKNIPSIPKRYNKIIRVLDYPVLLFCLLFLIKKGDRVIFLFHENAIKIKFIKFFQHISSYCVVCLINDINSVRFGAPEPMIEKDMNLIAQADILLVPNKRFASWMKKYICDKEVYCIEVWDYLKIPIGVGEIYHRHADTKESVYNVVYAGNLDKSAFLRDLSNSKDVNYYVYGMISEHKKISSTVSYMGEFSPDDIVSKITQYDFGLVWDGESQETCTGSLGWYLRINNPHKMGLYLAANLPIIIWDEAANSDFVREYNCGLCIKSLSELNDKISNLTKAQYATMRQNAVKVGRKVREGFYLRRVLRKIDENS